MSQSSRQHNSYYHQVESTWSDAEEAETEEAEGNMEEDSGPSEQFEGPHEVENIPDEADAMMQGVQGGAEGKVVNESYIHVFLLKYVCPVTECGGTLAPLPGSDKAQCNMCGMLRSEQDFMQEMQQYC